MTIIVEKLKKNKLTLIVSLPENSPELAIVAQEAGADAIKVHLNVHHDASGTHFGTFAEEKESLIKIIKSVNIPVGIMPGADEVATESELEELKNMGFDFLDIYVQHMPGWMSEVDGLAKIVAIGERYDIERLMSLDRFGADAVEASIIPHEQYGKKLTIGDLQDYITIAVGSPLPVIVPTQKKIDPDEVPLIADSGVKGLMIGAIVTGKTPESIKNATRLFRKAIDSLSDD